MVSSFIIDKGLQVDKKTPLWEVLKSLNEPMPNHIVNTEIEGASAERGKDLVIKGFTTDQNGNKTKRVSKHFECTACHNVVPETHNMMLGDDPDARLMYAAKHQLPFLQGSPLYGIVNRTSFYNGDYEKKYGDLVKPTRNNLREAIQLCAVECSQGRKLETWEVESILMYLWTIDLKMENLNLGDQGWKKFNAAYETKTNPMELAKWVKTLYSQGAGATFVDPPKDPKEGYGEGGDVANGKLIYDLGCKHCHENERYSFLGLDDGKLSFQLLKAYMPTYSKLSVYHVGRYGTKPLYGKRAYMPHYTKEKMSNEQMEDLRAYIYKMAE